MAMFTVNVRGVTSAPLTKSGMPDKRYRQNIGLGPEFEEYLHREIVGELYYQLYANEDLINDLGGHNRKKKKIPSRKIETSNRRNHKGWLVSSMGIAMIGTNLVSEGFTFSNSIASTDLEQYAMASYTAIKGMSMTAIGHIPKVGPLITTILGCIDGMIGDKISNQIHLQYDHSRLDYNLTTMDVGRNSTYTYDNISNKWIARDVQRVRETVLNQTTSV